MTEAIRRGEASACPRGRAGAGRLAL